MTFRHLQAALVGAALAAGLDQTGQRGLLTASADGNLGLLEIRNGKWTTKVFANVLVRFSVQSRVLADVFGETIAVEWPRPEHHWHRHWMYIHEQNDLDFWNHVPLAEGPSWTRWTNEVETNVVPLLKEHTSDAGLARCWATFEDVWLPPVVQLTFLGLLQQSLDDGEALHATTERLARHLRADGPDTPGAWQRKRGIERLGLDLFGRPRHPPTRS